MTKWVALSPHHKYPKIPKLRLIQIILINLGIFLASAFAWI